MLHKNRIGIIINLTVKFSEPFKRLNFYSSNNWFEVFYTAVCLPETTRMNNKHIRSSQRRWLLGNTGDCLLL